ncbi:MAG: hypothetical protein RRY07_05720 [Bacteroidaceae bacterium]
MANKILGEVDLVSSILRNNSVMVEVGGSVRRITLDNFMNAINSGDEQLLRQVAWGVPLKESLQSSPAWGVVGNRNMWEEYKSKCGRHLVTNTGKSAKISPNNSAMFSDGTPVDETRGHVMFRAPRLYYVVKNDATTGVPYLWMSQIPIGGKFIDDTCVGAYKASKSGPALVSRSGVIPAGSITIDQFWSAAQVNGSQFGLANYDFTRLMIMLNLSEYGNPNVQTNIGYGIGGSSSLDLWPSASNLLTGATKSLGDESGKIDIVLTNGSITGVSCSRVNFLGVEDLYGWQWEIRQGMYFGCANNTAQNGSEVFVYDGNRIPSVAELSTHPSGKYRQFSRLTTSGFIAEMTLGEHFDIMAHKIGGGSESYWCDYTYNNTIGQLLLVGGYASAGSFCGLGCANSSYAFSYANSYFGSRLAYYGKLQEMNGKELSAA